MPISVISVASYYSDTIDGLVIDRSDTDRAAEIEAMGIRVKIADTVMHSEQDKINQPSSAYNSLNNLIYQR